MGDMTPMTGFFSEMTLLIARAMSYSSLRSSQPSLAAGAPPLALVCGHDDVAGPLGGRQCAAATVSGVCAAAVYPSPAAAAAAAAAAASLAAFERPSGRAGGTHDRLAQPLG